MTGLLAQPLFWFGLLLIMLYRPSGIWPSGAKR